jgi:hypothetical protein
MGKTFSQFENLARLTAASVPQSAISTFLPRIPDPLGLG